MKFDIFMSETGNINFPRPVIFLIAIIKISAKTVKSQKNRYKMAMNFGTDNIIAIIL